MSFRRNKLAKLQISGAKNSGKKIQVHKFRAKICWPNTLEHKSWGGNSRAKTLG